MELAVFYQRTIPNSPSVFVISPAEVFECIAVSIFNPLQSTRWMKLSSTLVADNIAFGEYWVWMLEGRYLFRPAGMRRFKSFQQAPFTVDAGVAGQPTSTEMCSANSITSRCEDARSL
jgi:hypothetical protein